MNFWGVRTPTTPTVAAPLKINNLLNVCLLAAAGNFFLVFSTFAVAAYFIFNARYYNVVSNF